MQKVTLFVLVACIVLGIAFDFHLRPEFQKIKNETKRLQASFSPADIQFDCPKVPPQNPPPVNARRLRFSDIKVAMSLGDSMTAGTL